MIGVQADKTFNVDDSKAINEQVLANMTDQFVTKHSFKRK